MSHHKDINYTRFYCDSCGSLILPQGPHNVLPAECPLCGNQLPAKNAQKKIQPIPENIGNYQILRSLGRGGMGEVFLAYDPVCKREVALKRIRTDLSTHEIIRNRFLREALITSQLAHPAIVPIYSIHEESNALYYIMPFLEGKTLKQLIQEAYKREKEEKISQPHGEGSIASFLRIFVSVCQAIAYAHSKGFLHRDLKPENVIVGKYGQVLILDWGLVQPISTHLSQGETEEGAYLSPGEGNSTLTRPGKIVGTLAYMAPERIFNAPSSIQTDIYSLGVILYQLLTLHLPFKRHSLKALMRTVHKEELPDPTTAAPYRDVPPELSHIAAKALAASPESRYQTVDVLIQDLENYLEGRFSWFQIADLCIHAKKDWEFQENLFIPEYNAITRGVDVTDWVTLMVSKMSFAGNTQLNAKIKVGDAGQGIGLLLGIPEASERVHPTDGYCLWLNAEGRRSTKLFRSTIEVMSIPEIILRKNKWHSLRLEKQDHNIHFYLNDALKFSYISHLPLAGTHVGILYRDTDFELSPLSICVGSQNLTISCLALPDAFLANKDYSRALSEYRRIGYSFPGRTEAREALFRAGVTFLEQAKNEADPQKAEQIFLQAQEEFEKLHGTPGAPLEYLGKALIYEALKENEEEIKCLELACRRYGKNPLMKVLEEQILYRMHQSSQRDRVSAYRFILLVVRHLPSALKNSDHQKIFRRLQHHWEILPFIIEDPHKELFTSLKLHNFSIELAFWLAKPLTLLEILNELIKTENEQSNLIGNALFSLIELGAISLAEKKIEELHQYTASSPKEEHYSLLEELDIVMTCSRNQIAKSIELFFSNSHLGSIKQNKRSLFYVMEYALRNKQTKWITSIAQRMPPDSLSASDQLRFNAYRIWAFLLENEWAEAGKILQEHPLGLINQESTLLHFLYGCWLYATEGKEIAHIHFAGILNVAFPRTWALAAHYLNANGHDNKVWLEQAFLWEKRQLYRQLALYYHCCNDPALEKHFSCLESQQYIC